jgi:hypothetical protein
VVHVVASVVEAEAQRVVAAKADAEPLESRFGPRAAVKLLPRRAQPLVVAGEVAGEAEPAPVAAAVREIVELVDVVAAAVFYV